MTKMTKKTWKRTVSKGKKNKQKQVQITVQ